MHITKKQGILTVVSLLAGVLLFVIPVYRIWFLNNFVEPSTQIAYQAKYLDIEQRRITRYGANYTNCGILTRALAKEHIDNPLVLLPPEEWLTARGIKEFIKVEPAVVYYYAGIRTVQANSPVAGKADCLVLFGKNTFKLKRVTNRDSMLMFINEYKKYINP